MLIKFLSAICGTKAAFGPFFLWTHTGVKTGIGQFLIRPYSPHHFPACGGTFCSNFRIQQTGISHSGPMASAERFSAIEEQGEGNAQNRITR